MKMRRRLNYEELAFDSKPSSIHGNGWVALKDIHKNTALLFKPLSIRKHGFNSACNANVILVDILILDRLIQIPIVIKDVKEGEELTVNYGYKPCNCGDCKTQESRPP